MKRIPVVLLSVAGLLFGVSARAATISVTTLSDAVTSDGLCSLREAMINADKDDSSGSTDCIAGSGADTIVFTLDGTIAIGSTLPASTSVAKTTIDGAGHAVVVDGVDTYKIFKISAGAFELRNLTVTRGNTGFTTPGGGAEVAGALTVTACTFSNHGGSENGGAIAVDSGGSLSVADSTFSGNKSAAAAVFFIANSGVGSVDISRSLFIGNRPISNCGISVGSGPVNVSNSTFYDNAVNGGYSGAAFCAGVGTLTILNSTFLKNTAATLNGGAIFNGSYPASHVVVRNTIIDATGTTASTSPCSGLITDGGGNIDTGLSCGFSTAASYQGIPSGIDLTGPKDNGGPTLTIALLAGSAAIDKGDPATCAAAPISGLDQRGKKRPLDGDGDGTATCDIGAFEVLASNGIACTADAECGSAHCVDSVCCDTGCGGGDATDCQACSVAAGASIAGTCGAVTDGKTCAGGTCASGACTPIDAGPSDTGTDTAADTEVDSTMTDTGTDTGGPVTDVMPSDPAKPPVVDGNAKSCTTASECPSGFCVDHVCCNEACEGTCRSCALPQAPGLCALQPLGYDLRSECESDKPCYSTCANGACVPSFAGARCAEQTCTGPSTGRGAAVCSNLKGQCLKDQAIDFDCAPYACAPAFGACLRDCATTADCAPGNVCDLGSQHCVTAATGEDSGGCAIGSRSSGGFAALLLALVALGRTRRRRAD